MHVDNINIGRLKCPTGINTQEQLDSLMVITQIPVSVMMIAFTCFIRELFRRALRGGRQEFEWLSLVSHGCSQNWFFLSALIPSAMTSDRHHFILHYPIDTDAAKAATLSLPASNRCLCDVCVR